MDYDEITEALIKYDTECKKRLKSSTIFNFMFETVKYIIFDVTKRCEWMNELRIYPYLRCQNERIEYTPLDVIF
jgi:hypothetical protein